MEIAAIVIAIWLILVGLYGAWPLLRKGADEADDIRTVATVWQPQRGKTLSFLPDRPEPRINLSSTTTTSAPRSRTSSDIYHSHTGASQKRPEIVTISYRRRDVGQKRPRFHRIDVEPSAPRSKRRQTVMAHIAR